MVVHCLYTMMECTRNRFGAAMCGVLCDAYVRMKGVRGGADYRDDGVHGVQIAQLHHDEKQTYPF
jgi:hypothetical protein